MSRAPRVTGPELIAALARAGFDVLRIKGSHYSSGTRMGPGLLHKILRDCHMTTAQLSELL